MVLAQYFGQTPGSESEADVSFSHRAPENTHQKCIAYPVVNFIDGFSVL